MSAPRPTLRLDKWLWHARFCKSRAIAHDLVLEGRVRVNGVVAEKPARAVGSADVLTFMLAGRVRVIKVLALGERRGPAPEAQALYEDLSDLPAAVTAELA